MIKSFSKHHPAICLISVIGILLTSAGLCAAEPVSLSTKVVDETEGFLSDPARAGGLVGTILGGAAIANPLAPILGSVLGYFIGKNTDYTDSNSNKAQRDAWANRSLIPNSGDTQVASLSGLSGEPAVAEQPAIAALIATPIAAEEQMIITPLTEAPAATEQPANVALVEKPTATEQPALTLLLGSGSETKAKGNLNEQQLALAYACNNVGVTQQMPVYCYYYSQ
jgi:hypothetical protein